MNAEMRKSNSKGCMPVKNAITTAGGKSGQPQNTVTKRGGSKSEIRNAVTRSGRS